MRNFYGSEERRIANLKPKVEVPPELQRKLEKEQKRSLKQEKRKK